MNRTTNMIGVLYTIMHSCFDLISNSHWTKVRFLINLDKFLVPTSCQGRKTGQNTLLATRRAPIGLEKCRWGWRAGCCYRKVCLTNYQVYSSFVKFSQNPMTCCRGGISGMRSSTSLEGPSCRPGCFCRCSSF
jgi:hypothetical protein